jgi:AsmA family protein
MEPTPAPVRRSRWRYLAGTLAVLGLAIVLLILVWDWNWLRPFVEARASIALGRPVTMDRLEVRPGQVTGVIAYGVKVSNPAGFKGPDFLTLPRLSVTFEPWVWWHSGRLVLRTVDADQPQINVDQTGPGVGNWIEAGTSSAMEVRELGIEKGTAHVHVARQESDVTMTISTSHTANGDVVTVDGKGTHARQPITFHAVGGALLAARDPNKPYPVDLQLANGETHITLKGHIRDPLALTGADLNLVLSGPDMALLLPLTGIATPETPPYRISGRLDFHDGQVRFSDIEGRVGSSDLSGELDVDPRGAQTVVNGSLLSRKVDLVDLGGFVGATPGRASTPGETPSQVAEVKRAEASPKLLPTRPISVSKVKAADIHLTYRGEKVIGQSVPFDTIDVKMDVDGGHIRLAPLRLGIGGGALSGTIDLMPAGDEVDSTADVTAEHVDIGRLLATAGLGTGRGSIDGTAKVKGRGASLSAVLAHGDGAIRAVMPNGGNVNSLLVDLMGAEIGNAFLAAIGIPDKEAITCALTDFTLQRGVLISRALEVNTSDHVITGGGRIDLSREVMEMTLRTDVKHFTIGKLATPLLISGSFKDLHYAPAPDLAVRGGAAIGLGLLFPPAAILPTIQFGVGEGSPCAQPAKPPTPR